MSVIDILFLAIVAVFAFFSYRRGFMRTILEVVAFVLAIILASFLAKPVGSMMYNSFIKNSDFSLELEDYYKMKFDIAIEDSPAAFQYFSHLPELKVFVIDRPWNQGCEFPGDNFRRCYDWETIRKLVEE